MQRATGRRVGGLGRAEVPGLNDAVTIPRALSDRVNQLIQGIRPGRASEQRRHGIADYVRRLIVKCFQPEHKVGNPLRKGNIFYGRLGGGIYVWVGAVEDLSARWRY